MGACYTIGMAPPSDSMTLSTEAIASDGLAALQAAGAGQAKAEVFAGIVVDIFNDYYRLSRRIPWLAKAAFETCDWPRSIWLSQRRLAMFGDAIRQAAPLLSLVVREADRKGGFWNTVEERFRARVAGRYEQDLALAFLASLRRRVYHDVWLPIAYQQIADPVREGTPGFLQRIDPPGQATPAIIADILALPDLKCAFRDLDGDSTLAAERINTELNLGPDARLTGIEMITAGFYRNRGAYIVGGLTVERNGEPEHQPLALALLNGPDGVYVDAVILRETTLRHVFSSTLANFHVTLTAYHELVDYLFRLMPARPRGLHYSTVGYNHVGKLAVIDQVTEGLDRHDQRLDHAPGPRGSVSFGMTSPDTSYVLKVVRDTPTDNYKWDRWDGVDAVLAKYRRVHEINRSGSMLDNIIWTNVSLPAAMFEDALLEELMEASSSTVSRWRDEVVFRHLIAQRKVTPLPIYLETASPQAAEMAVIRLGQCIRNNASANTFNRDLDGRNYGISTLGFCYLFDYDAVEPLTEIKVRTNAGREDGEEDIPDWFFEDGPIFLPEELEAHLRLPDRGLRRLFREAHGELLTLEYWERMQRRLAEGAVPRVRTYPRSTQLRLPADAPASALRA